MNLVVNAVLIPSHGAVGAVIGTVLAELTVFLVQVQYLKKELRVYLEGLELWKIAVSNLAAFAVMASVRHALGLGTPAPAGICFLRILGTGILFCLCYGGVLMLLKEKHIAGYR